MGRAPAWSDQDDDLLAAARLSALLRTGHQPAGISSQLPTCPGETVYSQLPGHLSVYTGADVAYSSGAFVAFGNPVLTVATIGGSLLFNNAQRRKAENRAAQQWRHANSGIWYFTSHRVALQGRSGWWEIGWAGLRNANVDATGIFIWGVAGAATKLHVDHPAWHYTLLRYLAWQQILDVPIPGEMAQRALDAGRPLPPPTPTRLQEPPADTNGWAAPRPEDRRS